jgi:Spy/CpxP family protein refolding chaperone
MTRLSKLVVALAAASTLAWCGSAVAAEDQARAAGGAAAYSPQYLMVPGHWMLSQEGVQKEIGLSDEQKEKLRAIGKKYYEQVRQGYPRQSAIKWQELSEEERKQKMEEMREKAAEAQKKRKEVTDALTKQVEEVLSAEQLAALKDIEFRQRAGYMLRNARVLEAIGASKKQQARLDKNQQQLNAKIRELQRKASEKAFDVLTPEQMEKLRKLHQEGYRSVWQRGQNVGQSRVQPQGRVRVQAVLEPKAEEK